MQTASVDRALNASLYQLSDSDKSTLLTGISIICSDAASGRLQPLSGGTLRIAAENLQRCLLICDSAGLALRSWIKTYLDDGLRTPQAPKQFDKAFGYAAWSALLKDETGADRPPMMTLHYIYDALRHTPDLNEQSLAEKVKLFSSASNLPIEDVLFYPRPYLRGEAVADQDQPGDVPRAVKALCSTEFACDTSDYLALSYNLARCIQDQLEDPVLKTELSHVLNQVSRDYLNLNYESAQGRLTNFVMDNRSRLAGLEIGEDQAHVFDFLTQPALQIQEPSLDNNYTRRYFEKAFSEKIIQECFDDVQWPDLKNLLNEVAKTLFSLEVNTKEEATFLLNNLTLMLAEVPWADANSSDLKKCLQYLTEDWMWGKTDTGARDLINLNARQKASVMALEEPLFRSRGLVYRDNAKRKIEITRDQQFGAMKHSRATGPIRANQPMPATEQAGDNIINAQIEICTYDRNPDTYPHQNTRIPYVSSLSGHMIWQSVALTPYLKEKKDQLTKAQLEKNINQLFLLTAALYTLEGYHSLHEVLDALELPSIQRHFADFGLNIDPFSLVDAAWIRHPLVAAGHYAQTQILREAVNFQIAG